MVGRSSGLNLSMCLEVTEMTILIEFEVILLNMLEVILLNKFEVIFLNKFELIPMETWL